MIMSGGLPSTRVDPESVGGGFCHDGVLGLEPLQGVGRARGGVWEAKFPKT